MKLKLFNWLGREFVEVAGEGQDSLPADIATGQLFEELRGGTKIAGSVA
jgi:hypothetical protein